MVRMLLVPVILVVISAFAYLLLWPVDLEPARWDPPEAPFLRGPYASNDRLSALERMADGVVSGPEDIAIDSRGRACTGLADGRILCADPNIETPAVLANTRGRPLGLGFDADGNLIVADAIRGLLSVSSSGQVSILANQDGEHSFRFTNDVDVATDGTIYFSDSSYRHGPAQFMEAIIEHRPRGRLLAYDPKTGNVTRLLGELFFANGVAVSPDQSFALVVETAAYRVKRYWLRGPNAGKSEIFIENLPGFPDGISSNGRDTFWLAIYAPRSAILDALMPRPFLRKTLLRLPAFIFPEPPRYGFVLGLDLDGRVIHNLQDPAGGYAPITSVEEFGGWLYLGSLMETAIGRVRITHATSETGSGSSTALTSSGLHD